MSLAVVMSSWAICTWPVLCTDAASPDSEPSLAKKSSTFSRAVAVGLIVFVVTAVGFSVDTASYGVAWLT